MDSTRQNKIIEYLKNHKVASVEELVAETSASPSSIRRDLVKLTAAKVVNRFHGSVTLAGDSDSQRQPTTREKLEHNMPEKQRIGREASRLITEGKSVLFDAGTTTIEIAHNILDLRLRVITSDLNIGLLLCGHDNIDVSIVGGTLDSSSQSCIGDGARAYIAKLHPNFIFISCNAWDIESGITAPILDKANYKTDLLNMSGTKVLVADSSKFGKSQLYEVGPLSDLDIIVTDKGLPSEACDQIRQLGVELILV